MKPMKSLQGNAYNPTMMLVIVT